MKKVEKLETFTEDDRKCLRCVRLVCPIVIDVIIFYLIKDQSTH